MRRLLKSIRSLHRLAHELKKGDRRLILKAWILLNMIRLGLWLLPFQVLRQRLAVLSPVPGVNTSGSISPYRIIRAVELSSHYSPGCAKCLARALTTQVLLHRAGHPAELRIGVLKGENDQFEAHAWVESHGRVVMGQLHNLSHYTPLPLTQPVGMGSHP